MKKAILVLTVLLVLTCAWSALAESSLESMTLEELYQLRTDVNNEIAARAVSSYEAPDGKSLAEIFPDEGLARMVRDKLGKISTKDVVTQDELDTVTEISASSQFVDGVKITTLEGLQYLRNLERLYLIEQPNISEIPEWIGTLSNLTYIDLLYTPITSLPDSICNLTNLKTLDLRHTNIDALPDAIGNLVNLEELDISGTKITALPESIYNLSLKTFAREGLDID